MSKMEKITITVTLAISAGTSMMSKSNLEIKNGNITNINYSGLTVNLVEMLIEAVV